MFPSWNRYNLFQTDAANVFIYLEVKAVNLHFFYYFFLSVKADAIFFYTFSNRILMFNTFSVKFETAVFFFNNWSVSIDWIGGIRCYIISLCQTLKLAPRRCSYSTCGVSVEILNESETTRSCLACFPKRLILILGFSGRFAVIRSACAVFPLISSDYMNAQGSRRSG